MKEQILIFGEAINLNKDKSAKQSFFLRYIQFINQLGYNIKAFEQLNIQKIYEIDQNSQINLQKSEINYGEPNNSLDQKSYSGQKFLNDQQLNEFNKIKVGKLNIIRQIKLRLISENIKNSMSNAFKKQNNLQENIEHAVNLFIISENGNKKLKQKILMSLNRKRQLFNNLVMNNIKLFTEAKQLLIKLKKIERQLDKLYDQFPSRKMQALSAFFQAEIMNNYFSAYKISMLASISDEKLLKMQSQISLDLFSNKIEYLIFGFDQHCHRLKIQQTSNRIHQFFGYSLEQFISQDFIEFILPQGFHIIHQNLVQNFLQTGESKFFRSINLSFCQTINKFMKPLDFFFDINLASFDDLRFISFLQETQIQSAYLFCCQNNRIQSMTKNIVQKLGVPSKYGQQLVNLLLKQQITKFFPKYHNIYESFITRGSILNKDQFEQTIQDDKQSYFDKSENQIIMNIPELQILENQQKINWNENDHIHQLYVDVVFHLRNVQQDIFEYLIVEIREAKKMTNTELSTPYQTERPLSTNNNLEYLVQQSDFDNNFGIIEDNEIYQINTPQALELDNFDQQIHFGQRLKISHNSQHLYPNISIVLASPKDSTVRLIDDKPEISLQREVNQKVKNLKNKQQNQYFFAQQQKEDQDSSNYISSLRPNQQDENNQLQLVGIDQEVQNRIKLQIQDDNIENNQILQRKQDGSETSSLGDIKKSKYSKKYILIQKIISSPKFSHHFNKMKYILSLLFLNFVIFGLVEVYFLNSDLPQFLKELDLLQIKVNIIGPIDNYIVGQNDVVNYQILVLQKKMTEIEAQKNSIYSVNEINYTFYELKTSFENQLQNPYIDPFFEDRYIDVWMAKYPNLVSYNIRVREAIQLELEAALNFIQIDFLRATNIDFTQGFFAFLFKNYQSLRHLFQNLNEEMLDYSTNRSTLVSKNWHQLLIPILIIGSCLMMASMIFYRIYLQQYDRFLQLFSYIDSVWIQNDIARYRGFVGLLNKNQDVLFKYQFDIETKEKIIQNEEEKKEQQRQNQTQQKEKQNLGFIRLSQKMSYIPSTLTFLLIYGVCFIFCFISNSLGQNYYQKYPETTKFFNLLSDLSMASSGIFSMREISYTIQGNDTIFYFFPEKNASYFIDVFFKHVKVIDNFLEGFAIFDSSNYITSERFVANFYELMKSDICMFLPEYKIFGAQQHCNSALDGVMRNGMIQTLNKVRNQLLNEFEQSNNFSIETINIQSDLEIGLIAYDVLNDLRDQFQNELTNTTNALIQQVLVYLNKIYRQLILHSQYY
ncbi:unnamed protein product [Paramecium sonneborni]|uniref:PAS domain-containing protein n=1 Tax=Paramecium sonneborni TaxID=65129 RepID=A0A8S1LPV4_9CILI|nr:unnamed protein product [Paramecium sonneborni]